MNVFEAVKQSVTTRQAAEHYGIHVGRNGMACCPFHHDKTPSMKLDRRYHCFGCGADGNWSACIYNMWNLYGWFENIFSGIRYCFYYNGFFIKGF